MSPLCIEILLWHYSRAAQYPDWNLGSAQGEIKRWLLSNELLIQDGPNLTDCRITERGRVLVHALCATPLPVLKWAMP